MGIYYYYYYIMGNEKRQSGAHYNEVEMCRFNLKM